MSSSTGMSVTLEKLVALCKRRGFVYQSAEIYGGLNGVYDIGHLGTLMRQNIKNRWQQSISDTDHDVLFFEGSLLAPPAVWQASGHIENFHDPMVDCLTCKHRYRTDEIDIQKPCPHCGNKNWTDIRQFNMMFKTQIGATADSGSIAYLRPETAQSIFVNFKNVLATNRVKVPFGIAQVGKAFRNEITPKQFLFRMREFEQMELEWFCKAETAAQFLEYWIEKRRLFYTHIGITPGKIRLREHAQDELAHYSTRCIDVEYEFPFGWKELEGIAHRGSFDLDQHSKHSAKDLSVHDEELKSSYMPHIVECSVGVDRLFLTLLFDAYREDIIENESRVVLALHPSIAPIKAAFFPLTKKQTPAVMDLYKKVAKSTRLSYVFDESGSIGKRYRRQDEIGTPACFTYDFDSEVDGCVTVRNRDTTTQERININQIDVYMKDLCL